MNKSKKNRQLALLLMLTLFLFCANAYAQEQGQLVTVHLKNASLNGVLSTIEKQTTYHFSYRNAVIDEKKNISITKSKVPVTTVLDEAFAGRDLEYSIVSNKSIVISEKRKVAGDNVSNRRISGIVKDVNGDPIIGANVTIKGTSIGRVTDADGNFSFEAPIGATLTVTYIGYLDLNVKISNSSPLHLVMKEDAMVLDEVVAIGYGTQVRKNLSSSISKVKSEHLQNVAAPSFESALQGRAAGVQVTTGSALGGSGVSIRIRGTSSVSASSEPLYVIDGIPMESGAISDRSVGAAAQVWDLQIATPTNVLASLNPNDIESLEVLKDASAAAIYGSRGANGVVLITTKKGKAGKMNVSASASFGISTATRKPKLLNSEQYIELAQEAWTNSGNSLNDFWNKSGVLIDGLTKEQALNTHTDWKDETLRTGITQDYNVSVSGGSEKIVYYVSANMKDEKTILKGNHYQKFSTRMNLESQVNEIFRVGSNLSFSSVKDNQAPTGFAGGVGLVTFALPIWPVYKEDGSYFNFNSNHPLASITERTINLNSNQFIGNWFVKANIFEGLTARTDFGVNLLSNDDFHYKSGKLIWHKRSVSSTVLGRRMSWDWKNVLNYMKALGQHNFDVVLATEMQKSQRHMNTMLGEGFFNTVMTKPQDAETKKAIYLDSGYAFMSYIGRVNYSYNDTYLFSASMRADGSSRFAKSNRWGYFPAVSLGYTVSNESYFKTLKSIVNFLKLRASYGIVGNAEIGDYAYYSSYANTTYNGQTGIKLSNLGDDKLGWEQTAQLDLGVNLELFNSRLSIDFDYYDKRTKDLLIPYPVSVLTGVSRVTRNIGELSNKGFEVSINSVNIQTRGFTWETNLNFAHNKNEVTKLTDGIITDQSSFGNAQVHLGYPIGTKYRPVWAGVDPATGEDAYLELSGNKLLYSQIIAEYGSFNNYASKNQQPTGNPYPKLTGGFSNNFTFKNWSLGVLFTFATGMDFDLGMQRRSLAAFGSSKYNPYATILDRWQKPGDIATVSKLTTDNINWTQTTETLHRTDYLRLKDVTLGYTFKLKKGLAAKNLNCYIKGVNLLTFTKAPDSYWDPEWTQSGTATEAADADATAPQATSLIVGIKVDF